MRLRVAYSKLGRVRFVGHRDLARIWERAARRANVPLVYSEGFTPHPKISFGGALPVGWESTAEYLDMSLAGDAVSGDLELESLAGSLGRVLPDGIDITELLFVDPKAESLSAFVTEATYHVAMRDARLGSRPRFTREIGGRIEQVMEADAVLVTRLKKGEEVTGDIRPLIARIDIADLNLPVPAGNGEPITVEMVLATKPRVLRPEEVAAAFSDLGTPTEVALVRRTAQHGYRKGARLTPFEAGVTAREFELEGQRLDETFQEKEKERPETSRRWVAVG